MKKTIIFASILSALSLHSFATEYESTRPNNRHNIVENEGDVFFTTPSTQQRLDLFSDYSKKYIVGNEGDAYEINICNYSSGYRVPQNKRKLYIVSVDGLNVITGKPASYEQSGYVVSPGECTKIKGWRKNMHEEAQFYLTNVSNSYASRTSNSTNNLGVIGFAIFDEYIQPHIEYNKSRFGTSSTNSVPGAMAQERMIQSDKLGTGHGSIIVSDAKTTEFKKESNKPSKVLSFYYNSYETLLSQGIIKRKQPKPIYYGPNPFPVESGFAKDPN
ncbi:hypothetical protein GW796_08805 [archaeon]|nr:hypothetical protein [archaeon]NCQ51978.1 hypothetical protein [archaeon]